MSPLRRLLVGATLLAGPLPGGAQPAGAEPARVHRVAPGETLSHIALHNLGDPSLWPAIYEANRDRIKDPSVIYPGQELAVPELDPARREAVRREAHARNGPGNGVSAGRNGHATGAGNGP